MSWCVEVKIETIGNGDPKTMSETIVPTYAEAVELGELFEMQGRSFLSFSWDELGPPKWEINFQGLQFQITITEVS